MFYESNIGNKIKRNDEPGYEMKYTHVRLLYVAPTPTKQIIIYKSGAIIQRRKLLKM
jgi:hypothetical protein